MRRWIVVSLVVVLFFAAGGLLWADSVNLPPSILVQLKFQNWDVGSQYVITQDGVYNETVLHNGTITQIPPPSANPGEDGWGIFELTTINDFGTGKTLWSAAASGTEITGIFWGLHDWEVIQTNTGKSNVNQDIRSRGLEFAFYYDTTPDFQIGDPAVDRVLSPGVGGNPSMYLPFYQGVGFNDTDGTLIWTGKSVPGFIPGDSLNEFESNFNPSTLTSIGGFYANMEPVTYVDGSGVTHTLTGSQNNQFTPFSPSFNPSGPFADIQFQFTGYPAIGTNWLVKSDDPALGLTATPELSSCALFLVGLAPIVAERVRRRKRA